MITNALTFRAFKVNNPHLGDAKDFVVANDGILIKEFKIINRLNVMDIWLTLYQVNYVLKYLRALVTITDMTWIEFSGCRIDHKVHDTV